MVVDRKKSLSSLSIVVDRGGSFIDNDDEKSLSSPHNRESEIVCLTTFLKINKTLETDL